MGAVAIRHTQAPAKPSPVAAAPAPPVPASDVIVVPPIRSKPIDEPHHKAQHKPTHKTQGGDQDQTGTVPVDAPESPVPTDPSPTPVPEGPPPPPPPAPDWSTSFSSTVALGDVFSVSAQVILMIAAAIVLSGLFFLMFERTVMGKAIAISIL